MSLIVPITIQREILENFLTTANFKLRLYSNNYIPSSVSVIGSFTEVSGGGYAAKDLSTGDWTFSPVPPVSAMQPAKTIEFTGATDSPGTVYGYYITDVAGTTLYWAEAMPITFRPFTPVNGASVRITPFLAVTGGIIGG